MCSPSRRRTSGSAYQAQGRDLSMAQNCNLRAVAVTETRNLPLMEQFFAVRRFSSALDFTADGTHLLFAANISGQFNLWRVPVEGGWPDQLTAFTDETVRGVGVSPTNGRVVLCADHDGDEFHQLYLLHSDRGWPEKLTDEPEVQHYVGNGSWSVDGTKFAYAANARRPTDMEVWVRDAETGETRPVFGEGKFSFPGRFSPDGSKLLAIDFRNNSDVSIHLIDLDSGETRELTPHDDDATMSADGRVLGWLVNDQGYDRLRLRDLETGQDLPEPDLPAGARPHLTGAEPPLALSADGTHAALILSTPRRPPEAWIVETAIGKVTPVTDSRMGGLYEDD